MTTYTVVAPGSIIQSSYIGYAEYVLIADKTLAWPTQFQTSLDVVAATMRINPTLPGLSLIMPDARAVSTGMSTLINNFGGNALAVKDNLGVLIANVPVAGALYFLITDNTTQGGIWITFPFGVGGAAVTSVNAADLSGGNLVITGAPGLPITTVGTIRFALGNDLLALTTIGVPGYAVKTAANTWVTRAINPGSANITVVNPLGTAGNTVIDLAANIATTGGRFGNINIAGNTISSVDVNGPILLTPNGVGAVNSNSDLTIRNGNSINFLNAANTFSVSLSAPAALAAGLSFKLPLTDASTGVFVANGGYVFSDGLGNLSFKDAKSGGAFIKGSVVFNGTTGVGNILYNIANITKNAVGNFTITFLAPFFGFPVAVGSAVHGAILAGVVFRNIGAASIDVIVFDTQTGALVDVDRVSCIFTGILN